MDGAGDGSVDAVKKIAEEISLHGKFERITVMDLRRQPGEVVESARLGKTFLITKAGKPVAVLAGLPGDQLAMTISGSGKIDYDPAT